MRLRYLILIFFTLQPYISYTTYALWRKFVGISGESSPGFELVGWVFASLFAAVPTGVIALVLYVRKTHRTRTEKIVAALCAVAGIVAMLYVAGMVVDSKLRA